MRPLADSLGSGLEVRPGARPQAHRGDAARGREGDPPGPGRIGPGVLSPRGRSAGSQLSDPNALAQGAFLQDPDRM